jgi:hypothetical protein
MINADKLNKIGDLIKNEAPGLGFSLIVFDFGDQNIFGQLREFRYISNAQRIDMIGALEAMLNKWKNEKIENN